MLLRSPPGFCLSTYLAIQLLKLNAYDYFVKLAV